MYFLNSGFIFASCVGSYIFTHLHVEGRGYLIAVIRFVQ